MLIPTDQDAWFVRRCIVEETTQALGLLNDIPGSALTLFDDRFDRRRTELTAYDEMFLRVLYNPEIKLGMTGDELRRVARRLIRAELAEVSVEVHMNRLAGGEISRIKFVVLVFIVISSPKRVLLRQMCHS